LKKKTGCGIREKVIAGDLIENTPSVKIYLNMKLEKRRRKKGDRIVKLQ